VTEEYKRPMTLAEVMDDETVTTLRTDAVVAQEIRDQLSPLLDQVCSIMAQAKADGLIVAWNIQPDSFGRKFSVVEIAITKPL
jgi:hypothetical protein